LTWWQNFIDYVNAGMTIPKIKVPALPKTVQSTVDWLYHQVAKTLRVFQLGLGESDYQVFLHKLVNHWCDNRLTPEDFAVIELLQLHGLILSNKQVEVSSV
jgi:hypothetical protein